VDLRTPNVSFDGHEIPVRPPHHIQRQALLGFAVLASRPGQLGTMREMAEAMRDLGALDRRPVEPIAAHIRYRILRAVRHALAGKVPREVVDRLIETVPNRGLRLLASVRPMVIAVRADAACATQTSAGDAASRTSAA